MIACNQIFLFLHLKKQTKKKKQDVCTSLGQVYYHSVEFSLVHEVINGEIMNDMIIYIILPDYYDLVVFGIHHFGISSICYGKQMPEGERELRINLPSLVFCMIIFSFFPFLPKANHEKIQHEH